MQDDLTAKILEAKARVQLHSGDVLLELIAAPDVIIKLQTMNTNCKPIGSFFDMPIYALREMEEGSIAIVPAGTDHRLAAEILKHQSDKAKKQKIRPGTIKGELVTWPADDGKRELLEDEFYDRMVRVSGDVICEHCGFTYFKHPNETRQNAGCVLKRLCNGKFGKL